MSVSISIDDLKKDEIMDLIKKLTLVPYDKYDDEMKKSGKYNPFPSKPPEPISMYITDPETRRVRVPYKFGCDFLKNHKINNKNNFMKIIDDEDFMVDLRPGQVKYFKKALAQLTEHNTTSLFLPPAHGKTILGILLAYMKGLMTIIYATRGNVADAWVNTIHKCLPSHKDKIWYVGKKGSMEPGVYFKGIKVREISTLSERPLIEGEEYIYIPSFIICLDQRYDKIRPEIVERIGTMIVDEAHMFCSKSRVGCLLHVQPKYVIIETATIQRPDKLEQMMELIVGTHNVYKRSDSYYEVYKVETMVQVPEKKTARGVSYGQLCLDLGQDMYRNSIILNIIKKNPHRKYIILTISVPHVKLLEKYLTENEIDCDTLFSNKNDYSDSHVLIGTMSKMGVGFDETNACKDFKGAKSDVLIMCHSVAQWQLFEQYVGRVKRVENPIVIWLNDKNKMVRNHFRYLEDWINLTNGKIVEKKFKPNEIILPERKDFES